MECPICMEMRDASSIEQLVHASSDAAVSLARTSSGRDVSTHVACALCREQMVRLGQGCPWCRDEVVWNDVCGFLDELKGCVDICPRPSASRSQPAELSPR